MAEFLGYRGSAEIHDGTVAAVVRDEATVIVAVDTADGRRLSLRFEGVEDVAEHRAEGMILHALAEVAAPPPLRRFVFVNWDEEDDASLEVVAWKVREA